MSARILIPKSPTADTRTCDVSKVSIEQLYLSSHQHINDVRRALMFFVWQLQDAAARHDYDKLTDIYGFHADFKTEFKQTTWWDRHRQLNRHHLLQADGVPADVNLIDVLDMIADCVMSGTARSGSVYALNLSPDVLMSAFKNTVDLLIAHVGVIPEPVIAEPSTPEQLAARLARAEFECKEAAREIVKALDHAKEVAGGAEINGVVVPARTWNAYVAGRAGVSIEKEDGVEFFRLDGYQILKAPV